ncbi:hypothetical protein V5799_016138 [Amblyomma americanum]|uniref:tRNA (guanine(26)-N(2))-dimethyltransferase n=1 Tax=Amblyomma americanum TaxID=6943 RepID=A0AAQ4F614_AMBAM
MCKRVLSLVYVVHRRFLTCGPAFSVHFAAMAGVTAAGNGETADATVSKPCVAGELTTPMDVVAKVDKVPQTSVTEGKAEVFFPSSRDVFYNPVQEFNRDMSIAVIQEFIAVRREEVAAEKNAQSTNPQAYKVSILEALAASGLRSIRYALEIEDVKRIVANDYSVQAVASMRANIDHNKVGHIVVPNRGEAALLMHMHKNERFDVIDLDPYGSAAPFLDSAVQAVKDRGLLLVTCTDMAILCGNSSETCRAKYGAVSLKTKCCHEMPLGRCAEKGNSFKFSPALGPPVGLGCVHCGHKHHIGGPIWINPLHDVGFVQRLISRVLASPELYGTSKRMLGILHMLTEELQVPLYFMLDRLASTVRASTPSMLQFRSALLNAGYQVSLSHACKNSVKTDAPMEFVWDIIRTWKLQNPSSKPLEPGSPGEGIMKTEPRSPVSFAIHPQANPSSREQQLLRYQVNPEPCWGPKMRAKTSLWADKAMEKSRRLQGKRKLTDGVPPGAKRPLAEVADEACQSADDASHAEDTCEQAGDAQDKSSEGASKKA